MEFNIIENGDKVRGVFKGRLDTIAATQLATELDPLLEKADKDIELDCSELDYISSSGLRIFLTIRKASVAKNGKLVVTNINDEIKKVFRMTGFSNLFEIR